MRFDKMPQDVEVLTFGLGYLAGRSGVSESMDPPFGGIPDEHLPDWIRLSWKSGLKRGAAVAQGKLEKAEWEEPDDALIVMFMQIEKLGPKAVATILHKQISAQNYLPNPANADLIKEFDRVCKEHGTKEGTESVEIPPDLEFKTPSGNVQLKLRKVSSPDDLERVIKEIVKDLENDGKGDNNAKKPILN